MAGEVQLGEVAEIIMGQSPPGDTYNEHGDGLPFFQGVADFILANPPFNISDWGGERLAGDKRWQYGTPPKGNANFAWVQRGYGLDLQAI